MRHSDQVTKKAYKFSPGLTLCPNFAVDRAEEVRKDCGPAVIVQNRSTIKGLGGQSLHCSSPVQGFELDTFPHMFRTP